MSLFRIALRSIQQRGLASALTSVSMALGVMLVVAVLTIHGVVAESFRNNASLGYNMIVGAKGGKLQLTLNTVYYLSQPVENVPYEYFLEFLTAEKRRQLKEDPGHIQLDRDGKYGPYCELAIPLCLGDYYGRFRVVGTTPDFFDQLVFGPSNDRRFEFAEGRNMQYQSEENGFFEAVVGSVAAREMEVEVGQIIKSTHGDPDGKGHGQGFRVVGVLRPSGTPSDRAVFVNMEGFYLLEGHAKPLEEPGATEDAPTGQTQQADDAGQTETPGTRPDVPTEDQPQPESISGSSASDAVRDDPVPARTSADEGAVQGEEDLGARRQPLPMNQREVTAVLIKTINPLVTPGLENTISEGQDAQAVLPVREIFNLFEMIVDPIKTVLLVLTAMICIVSGISILVSIYNSMSERRHEIAVMRALGAGRGTVMTIILLESVFLSLGGGAAGWLLGHTLNWLANPIVEAQTGVAIGFLDVEISELMLIPALIALAIICGFFPALSAYRTDVAKSLGA